MATHETTVSTRTVRRSRTSVVEAAMFLLSDGVLDVPAVGGVNVKQARALLWSAL